MVADGVIRKFAVAGAVAALYYTEPAVTEDLDILVPFDDLRDKGSGLATLEPLISYLRDRGYKEFEKEGIVVEGWPVQFLPVSNELDAEALNRAREVEFSDEPESGKIPILRPEHIVATALRVGRAKDRERIIRFVEEQLVSLRELQKVLKRHNLLEEWSKFRVQMGWPDFDEWTFEQKS
jgi:hypothetical protein